MSKGYRISDIPEVDRPRERLERKGPKALSNSELLAILLGSGMPGKNVVGVRIVSIVLVVLLLILLVGPFQTATTCPTRSAQNRSCRQRPIFWTNCRDTCSPAPAGP